MELMKLKDKIKYTTGYPFDSTCFSNDISYPYIIRIRDLLSQKPETTYSGCFEESQFIHKGDILIGMDGDFRAVWWKTQKVLLNQRICKVESLNEKILNNKYLFYQLSHRLTTINNTVGATTVKHLSTKDIQEIEIPNHPIEEQKKIADILSSLDTAIENNEALVNKLTDLKKALMQELFTKGIGHKDFTQSKIRLVPIGWDVLSLRAVTEKIGDGAHQSVTTDIKGEIPFLYISCVKENRVVWELSSKISESVYKEVSKGKIVRKGTVLYTAVGSYGIAAMINDDRKFTFQRHIAYINPDQKKLTPDYLMYWLNSPICKRIADDIAVGNAQKTITLAALNDMPIPMPSMSEQNRITGILKSVDKRLDTIKEKIGKQLKLKNAMMQDLLSGKVRVNPTGATN